MAIYIAHAGDVLEVPTESDVHPGELCRGGVCPLCLAENDGFCPTDSRGYQILADMMLVKDWLDSHARADTDDEGPK